MRVLVTGGAGFVGRFLVTALAEAGIEVRVLDVEPFPVTERTAGRVEVVRGDVRDPAIVSFACRNVDRVVHCAAMQPVSRSRRRTLWEVNVGGTRNVLESALCHGVRRVIHISSSAPYGLPLELPIDEQTPFHPVCDYGRSKLEAERVCRRYRSFGLDVVVMRPRVLIGPGRLGIYQMVFNWVADEKPIYILGSGDRPFQALSVNDLTSAVRSALEAPCENEDFNLGAAEYGSVRSDLEALLHHAGNGRRIVTLPAGAAKTALWMLDVLDLSPLTAWHYLTCDAAFYFDCSKAGRILGWRPSVNNAEMLCEAYDWYLAHRSSVDGDFGAIHTKSLEQRTLRVLKVLS